MARGDGVASARLSRDAASVALRRAEAAERALAAFDGDCDRAARFASGELGRLERLGPRSDRLLGTLEVFLEHGQRIANASAVSGQHRDTVHRHLREVEQLLDCRIEERSAELLWALRLRRVLLDSDYLT